MSQLRQLLTEFDALEWLTPLLSIKELCPDDHPVQEVVQELNALFIMTKSLPEDLPTNYTQHEAMVLTAYAVRNSEIVETVLHSGEGQILTDKLMPQFTGEISGRLYGLITLKEQLFELDRQDVWAVFIVLYHRQFCRDWSFYE